MQMKSASWVAIQSRKPLFTADRMPLRLADITRSIVESCVGLSLGSLDFNRNKPGLRSCPEAKTGCRDVREGERLVVDTGGGDRKGVVEGKRVSVGEGRGGGRN